VNTNTDFCRSLLRHIQVDVRKHKPSVKLLDAWVWSGSRGHWEFHYGEFFWHGSADNAYHARVNGWSAWLASEGVKGWTTDWAATLNGADVDLGRAPGEPLS
jgi:hypothetical protein